MKTMTHKLHTLYVTVALVFSGFFAFSCTDYQDEIDALEYRVKVLEQLVKEVNTNLEALKVIAQAMEDGDYITGWNATADGYVINFAKYGPLYIVDGKDGEAGKDAVAPDISVEQDPVDGCWYWKVNGEWLTAGGQRLRANGKDGKDAVSPEVRINSETGIWEISTDGGVTWTSTSTSATGKDGQDGLDGYSPFISMQFEVTPSGEFMVLKTSSGSTIRVPIYKGA